MTFVFSSVDSWTKWEKYNQEHGGVVDWGRQAINSLYKTFSGSHDIKTVMDGENRCVRSKPNS